MNGPEHYREAERLLQNAKRDWADGDPEAHNAQAATAQVHATLALAAATALQTAGVPQDGDTAQEWRRVICRPKITNGVTS